MKSKSVISALAVLSMAFAGGALAQPNGYTGGPQYQGQNRGNDARHGPQYQGQNSGNDARRGPQSRNDNRGGRGAGPQHNFYRGGRLPNQYRNRQYVVDDWRGHHLSAPPRGYHWVQTGGDYVLVAIASGIIAQILLGQ
jgi:Ni/Co efflux regulator RcnB